MWVFSSVTQCVEVTQLVSEFPTEEIVGVYLVHLCKENNLEAFMVKFSPTYLFIFSNIRVMLTE